MTLDTSSPRAVRRPAGDQPPLLARPQASYYLLVGATLALLALGLVMVLSASSVVAYADKNSSFYYVIRQGVFVVVGLGLLWWASRRRVEFWRWIAWPLLVVSGVLLSLVLVMGQTVNGNRNWLRLSGSLQIQPSELAKLALILWSADLLARKQKLLGQWKHLLVPLLPVAFGIVALVLLGGDLGTSLLLLGILVAVLFHSGAPLRLFVGLGGIGVGLVALMTSMHSSRAARLSGWLNPFHDCQSTGWQACHGIYALATGNWWGIGLGASREKWAYLPEAHTDFIFAIIGEELGLLGTVVVLLLIGTLVYAGVRVAVRSTDPFVRTTVAGIMGWIAIQATVNIGAVLGVLPITGVPLPLVSYGGSSLLPLLTGIGVVLSCARAQNEGKGVRRLRRRVD